MKAVTFYCRGEANFAIVPGPGPGGVECPLLGGKRTLNRPANPTSDFSVGMTWGFRERKWYLLDLFRGRLEYPDLKRKIVELHRR